MDIRTKMDGSVKYYRAEDIDKELEAKDKVIAELRGALDLSTFLHREGLEEYVNIPDSENYNDRVCGCIREAQKLLTTTDKGE